MGRGQRHFARTAAEELRGSALSELRLSRQETSRPNTEILPGERVSEAVRQLIARVITEIMPGQRVSEAVRQLIERADAADERKPFDELIGEVSGYQGRRVRPGN